MKKALSLALLLFLCLSLAVPALALTQGESFYVTDETGSLSRDTVDEVVRINEALEENYQAHVVVAFVNYFGDKYADEYAVSLFNEWSLSPRGMLLVVSPKEGRGGLTAGTEIAEDFTSDDMNRYLDRYFWDDFDKGKYDKAVTTLVGKLSGWYEDYYGPVSGGNEAQTGGSAASGALAGLGFLGVILGFLFRNIFIILIFAAIIVLIVLADRRRYRGYYMSIGMPVPRYYPWYMFTARPYRAYRRPRPTPPPPPPRGGYRPTSRPASRPAPRPSRPSRPSGGGHSGGGFGGRGGSGGFGGHSGGGRSGGGFGGRR